MQECIPFVESKFRIGKKKEMRAMAGLSMGSLQTSYLLVFIILKFFSALGIFSGFVTDIIQGTELDMVGRPLSDNEHFENILRMRINFGELFPIFF